jgi:hypothetical protein
MIPQQLEHPKNTTPILMKISKGVHHVQQDLNCFLQSPSFFLMRKMARFELVRNLVGARLSAVPTDILTDRPSAFTDLNPQHITASIQQDGYFLGLQLPPATVQAILHYAKTHQCYGDREARFAFYPDQRAAVEAIATRPFQLANYPGDLGAAVNQIIHDPLILAIAAQYLGTTPVLVGQELLWSFPVPDPHKQLMKAAQVMHCDIDDYRCLKFFFYLTDVDETNGPHACIPRTHRGKKLIHQALGQRCALIDDEKLIADYGGQIVTICGTAGFGFVEDPFCFHRGNPVKQNARLMLQIEYATHDYGNIRAYYERASTKM